MKDKLEIGQLISGGKFTLPLDLVTRTLAIIAIRGWGKTVAATVIAEEMCEAGLPWVAIDPVGVWWGLRANPDGSPGGYPVVILGGERADLPLEKSSGAKVAEAILTENVSCVIDMSSESKTTVRHFVAEFCDRLMELRPETPRHVFIEEAPELVPQRPMGEQKRSLAAVDRLIRLGRNRGYGATLISQRTATIQKDVLTQCESLLAGRSIGKPDREAMQDWIAEVVEEPAPTDANKFIRSLSGLESGVGWFWSPQWLGIFEQIRIRRRKTYHPGETRSVGQTVKQVKLSNVHEFVERFGAILKGKKLPPTERKESEDTNLDYKAAYDQAKQTIQRLERRIDQLERDASAHGNSLPTVIGKTAQGMSVAPSSDEVAMSLDVRKPVIDVTCAQVHNRSGRLGSIWPSRASDLRGLLRFSEEDRAHQQGIHRARVGRNDRTTGSEKSRHGQARRVWLRARHRTGTYQSVPGMKVNVKEVSAIA